MDSVELDSVKALANVKNKQSLKEKIKHTEAQISKIKRERVTLKKKRSIRNFDLEKTEMELGNIKATILSIYCIQFTQFIIIKYSL